ncbi:MAG TPA: CVNH domain-containing protein [Kofleriaceae bacterium]|nr:CVNH domain-containing protein [Kofleriaceae bacterium]
MSAPPPGSYSKTAKDVTFAADGNLTAQLQKMDGSWVGASYHYDLSNQNGVFCPLPAGNYNLSVRNIAVENRADGPYIVAECRKIDGSWASSALKLPYVENINGVLKVTNF